MDFAKSDLQTLMLDGAERLLAEHSGVEYWRAMRDGPEGFGRERWRQFAELGWLALPLPETAGGLAGSLEDVALLNVALGRALATEPYVSTVVLCGHILGGGDEGLSLPLLGAIAEGQLRLALAHQENGRDSLTLDGLATTAQRRGDGYILNGSKIMVLDAPSADKLVVSAAMPGEEGTALMMVDCDAPGVTLDRYALIDGTRAADITFHEVVLAGDAMITGGNRGTALLGEAIDRATIALLAQAVGSMEACLKLCGDYAKERKQFGVAIASFQAIQHMLADMFVAAHQARSMLYHALAHAGEDAALRAAALSAARLVIGEAGQLLSRNGIQIHGGYGLTDEYAISHHYRRQMTLEKLYGDLERHTRRFGDSLFEAEGATGP